MSEPIIWVGLDVHKDSTTAAILEGDAAECEVLRLSADLMQVRRLFRRLSERGTVRACYEASGSGYVLQRVLSEDGFFCEVVAPSMIPRMPGDRRKTDRIDALILALFADRVRPQVRPLPDEFAQAFDALLARRRQLVAILAEEKTRLKQARSKDVASGC